jgi:hypothetical protein
MPLGVGCINKYQGLTLIDHTRLCLLSDILKCDLRYFNGCHLRATSGTQEPYD